MGAVLAWMTLIVLWSAILAAGFAYSAIAGADELSSTRRLVYALLAAFTGLLAARTAWEMVRKIVQHRAETARGSGPDVGG